MREKSCGRSARHPPLAVFSHRRMRLAERDHKLCQRLLVHVEDQRATR
jgi:hypothetical protein